MLQVISFFTFLRPFNRFVLFSFFLLLCGMEASGCFRRRPARITPTRQERWLPWTGWSACSATCGAGRITRHRFCRRGQECSSPEETEIKACVNYHCSDFNDWTAWSTCSASCGEGWKERSRPCPDSEKPCQEFLLEKRKCNAGSCPIDGGLTAWGAWSVCSVTCGLGTETRFRTCTNPPPQFGGADCREPKVSKRACNLVECHPKVHGQWNSWGAWGSCSRTCKEGVKKRIRLCNNPAPAFGGNSCAGSGEETQPCVVAQYCEKPVNGQWGSWHAWTECNVRCSKGTRTRIRTCSNPAPKFGGKSCIGKSFETESCTEICTVHGQWGAWQPVQECKSSTGKCSKGWQHLRRKCDSPAPQHGGKPCPGNNMKSIDCWDARGCAGGLQPPADFQTQSLENKTVLVSWRQVPFGIKPTNFEISSKLESAPDANAKTVMVGAIPFGSDTPADGRRYSKLIGLSNLSGTVVLWVSSLHIPNATSIQRAPTEKHKLVVGEVDGGWSAWDPWSDCSKTCGVGIRTRTRRCDSPTRTLNGRPCPGAASERDVCDRGFC